MKAIKYPKVDKLPTNAKSVNTYAEESGFKAPYIYIKYERAKKGETSVNYKIVNYQGFNFVIPE